VNPSEEVNPLAMLDEAARVLPGGSAATSVNLLLLLTALAVVPSVLILCTSFTRIAITLGILRQALGAPGIPPGQVVAGLSLFLSLVVMAPTGERMWREGLGPWLRGEETDRAVAWERTAEPLREFMIAQIEATGNVDTVLTLLEHRGVDVREPSRLTWERDVDLVTLVPAFVLSELKTAFLVGFRIWLPFLVIDLVVSSLLVSMGMIMLPPVLVSLPFKLLLFVLVDGWRLVTAGLLSGFAEPAAKVTAWLPALPAGGLA
jgi:flagellar biosynthetic protein FliP